MSPAARAVVEEIPSPGAWLGLVASNPGGRLAHEAEPDGQGIAEGLALLRGLELVVLADGPERRLVGAEARRGGRGPRRGGLVEVAGPVAGDPGELGQGEDGVGRLAAGGERPVEQGLDPALGRLAAGRPCWPGRRAGPGPRAGPGTRGREPAGSGRARSLIRASPSGSLRFGAEPFQAGGAPPDLGQLVRPRAWAGPASSAAPPPLAGRRNGTSRRWISSWCGPVQAGGDPPPEDPPLGPALHVLGVLDPLVEDRPEGLDPDLVEREARSRAGGRSRPG